MAKSRIAEGGGSFEDATEMLGDLYNYLGLYAR